MLFHYPININEGYVESCGRFYSSKQDAVSTAKTIAAKYRNIRKTYKYVPNKEPAIAIVFQLWDKEYCKWIDLCEIGYIAYLCKGEKDGVCIL